MSQIGTEIVTNEKGEQRRMPSFNPIFIMSRLRSAWFAVSRSNSWQACAG